MISVIMSVYNAEQYLRPSIESILNQTFKDFEFIIIDDGSSDTSKKVIESYKDPRIKLISRPNKGLTKSLNEGLSVARGKYIARQDADDISVKNRFEKQVKLLESNKTIGMVGSNYTVMDETGKKLVTTNVFTHPDDLKICQVVCNQFGHGSVMIRGQLIEEVGGYDESVGYVEDYDLWVRLSRMSGISNIEEPLYLWRKRAESITHSNHELQIQQAFSVRDKAFKHFMKHRRQYRIFGYHKSGDHYKSRRATVFRNLGYLYRRENHPFRAGTMMLRAIIFEPRNKRNYKYLVLCFYKPLFKRWTFDFL